MTKIYSRILLLAVVSMFYACSHAPRHADQASSQPPSAEDVQAALVEKLHSEPDFHQIQEVKVSSLDAGKYEYRLAYVTDSQDLGQVTHELEAQAELVQDGSTWKVAKTKLKSQKLEFHKPLLIEASAKK